LEIELPDGTVLDAPDGADVKQVVQGYQRSRQAKQLQSPAESGTNTYFDIPSLSFKERPNNALDTMTAGIGAGMVRFGRGIGNLAVKGLNKVLPDSDNITDLITGNRDAIQGGPFSDAAVREQDQIDKPLSNTTAGAVGQGIGQTAASLPLSLGYGAASSAARALPLAGRALANPLVRGGVEGTVNSAAVADVDRQGAAAGEGAAIGTGLSAGFGAGGRLVRGLVQKSGAAQDLERLASDAGKDIFVPIPQAADDTGDIATRAVRSVYRDVLPIAPGVSGQLKRQSGRAMDTVREMAFDTVTPPGTIPQATISALKDAFDQEYQTTVKQYIYDVPQDFRDQVEARIKAAMPGVDDTTVSKVVAALDDQMERFSSGKATIDGNNLLNAKNFTSEQMSKMRGPEKAALNAGKGVFDDIVQNEVSPEVFSRYQGLNKPYSAFTDVSKAVKAAKTSGGQFTPRQLASAARPGGELEPLAQAAQGTLGQPVATRSPWLGAERMGAIGYGVLSHNPVGVIGGIGGASLLATQTVQRAMMGDTAAQKAIQALIEAHPEAAAAIQTVIRNAATTQAGATHNPVLFTSSEDQ